MNEDASIYEFATPIYRVLLEPNQLFGIGVTTAMIILLLTIVLMNMINVWCVTVGVILFMTARALCKKDPYMLTILFDRLMQPKIWRR